MLIASIIGLALMALGYQLFSEQGREQRKTAKAIRDAQARRWAMTDDEWRLEQAERDRDAWKYI